MADKIVVHVEAGRHHLTEVGERAFTTIGEGDGDDRFSVPLPRVADRRSLGAHLYRRCSVQVGSETWFKAWERENADGGATCMLLADHDGPHEFTPDDQIGVTFASAPGVAP